MMYSCNDGQGETKITEIYSCFRDGNNIQIVRQGKGSIRNQIYPIVTDLKYDKQFLLVEQNPDSLWYHVDLSFSLDRSYSRNEQRKTIYFWPGYSNLTNNLLLESKNISNKNSSADQKIFNEFADSLIRNDPFQRRIFSQQINYWILEFSKDSLHGPFSKQQYLLEKKKLLVPKDLKLRVE